MYVCMCSYEQLRNEFDMINLKGRKLRVCSFYRPPVSYLNATIKKIINDVEEEVFLTNDGKSSRLNVQLYQFLLFARRSANSIEKNKREISRLLCFICFFFDTRIARRKESIKLFGVTMPSYICRPENGRNRGKNIPDPRREIELYLDDTETRGKIQVALSMS